MCYRRKDLKRLIAFSSVAHMNLILCGLYIIKNKVVLGLVLLSLGHGFIRGNMFLFFKRVYKISKTRKILIKRGNNNIFWLVIFMGALTFSGNASVPPSLKILSEFSYIIKLIGSFTSKASYLVLRVFISGLFSLYLYNMVLHGKNQFIKVKFNQPLIDYVVL
jgi:NADH:ubiquinone oxidoreductase subunit 4 (subunit M)